MNRLPFTKLAAKALEEGKDIAGYLGFRDVSSVFLMLGLYGTRGSMAREVLKMHGLTREMMENNIQEKAKVPRDGRKRLAYTPKSREILELAGELAIKYNKTEERIRQIKCEAIAKLQEIAKQHKCR